MIKLWLNIPWWARKYLMRFPFGNSYYYDSLNGVYKRCWAFPKIDWRLPK